VEYPGIDGFLGTRASIMLDVVFVAMGAFVPVLFWSIWQVRVCRRYQLHKRVQLALAGTLGVAIVLFEIDMRFISGWRERAAPSAYYPDGVFRALGVHLSFAVTTTLLWAWTAIRAWQRFPASAAPNDYSRAHRRLGWIAAIDMLLTTVTGWVFYWFAFVE
jgi:putative membrane protein